MTSILAVDVGATTTRAAVFSPRGRVALARQQTRKITDIGGFLDAFFQQHTFQMNSLNVGCVALAGPVSGGNVGKLTNGTLEIDSEQLSRRLGIRIRLVNDMYATATAISRLHMEKDCEVIHSGRLTRNGNAAVMGLGTGMNYAALHDVKGTPEPLVGEGGHTYFAPCSDRQRDLARYLRDRWPHLSCETVLSGPGLQRVSEYAHESFPRRHARHDKHRTPGKIVHLARTRRCSRCVATLDLFIEALASEASNVALWYLATRGVFLVGGVITGTIPLLRRPWFSRHFEANMSLRGLLKRVPVFAVTKKDCCLLGAAEIARGL